MRTLKYAYVEKSDTFYVGPHFDWKLMALKFLNTNNDLKSYQVLIKNLQIMPNKKFYVTSDTCVILSYTDDESKDYDFKAGDTFEFCPQNKQLFLKYEYCPRNLTRIFYIIRNFFMKALG